MKAFHPDMLEARTRELAISEGLRASIENDFEGFELVCQPQVCASDGKLKGGEALLRWNHPQLGMVPPVTFIPILEKTGMIVDVGKWVFKEAVNLCSEWVSYCRDFKISINISYIQLFDDDFLDFVHDTIANSNADFSNIIIELTESRFVTDKTFLNKMFDALRNMGICIAMDDFGTGYSSLEILKEVPADIVKIDRTFVRNIEDNIFNKNFIRFAVELCHNVGIQVCLEGIENNDEYQIVYDMNLDFIQGYYFGKPLRKDEFEKIFFRKSSLPPLE
jgi:EAL domain-containing protein (putative c-di-GMP-specific phosphodiesterase class I)